MKSFLLKAKPKSAPVRVKAKTERLLFKRLGDVRFILIIQEEK